MFHTNCCPRTILCDSWWYRNGKIGRSYCMPRIHLASKQKQQGQKGGFAKTPRWVLYWKSLWATIKVVTGLKSESNLCQEMGLYSWVRIRTCMNKYVMEWPETMSLSLGSVSGASTGWPAAKLKPKQMSSGASSSGQSTNASGLMLNQRNTMRIPSVSRRRWINCFDMNFFIFGKKTELSHSKMWRQCLSRNLGLPCIGQFEHGLITCRGRRSQEKISILYWSEQCGSISYLRALQVHSGGTQIDPSLQDLVVLPDDFAEYIYHVGHSTNLHSITRLGLIAGGRDAKKGRQTLFFTAVNPMDMGEHWQTEFDLANTRIARYGQKWKVHQNSVYWVNLKRAQRKGLEFY